MSLSIVIILALVCGREGSDVQDTNAEEEISHATAKEKNDTKTQRYEANANVNQPLLTFASSIAEKDSIFL